MTIILIKFVFIQVIFNQIPRSFSDNNSTILSNPFLYANYFGVYPDEVFVNVSIEFYYRSHSTNLKFPV